MLKLGGWLIHRCEIDRPVVTGEDSLGQPIYGEPITVYTGPCRFVEETEAVVRDDRMEMLHITTYKLILPADADQRIQDRDKVAEITLEDKRSHVPYMFTIDKSSVVRRRARRKINHIVVFLEKLG